MKILILFLAAAAASAQVFPGAVAGDSDLYVVGDNVQTTLSTAMALGDNVAIVASGTGWQPNMLATICDTTTTVVPGVSKCATWEHMLVTAVNGQALTVTRGKAGSTAAPHSVGKVISGSIDADHHNTLRKEIKAIEASIGSRNAVPNPSPIGQGAYYWQWWNPQWNTSGTPNVDGYYGLMVTTTPGPNAGGNIVGIYSAISTGPYSNGAKHTDIWAENLVANWNAGDPDTNVQISEMDINNLNSDTFNALKSGLDILNGYTYKAGTGLGIGTVAPGITGKWRTGLMVLDYSDVGIAVGGSHPGAYYPSAAPIAMLIREDYANNDGIVIQRSTDTSPTGYFLRLVNATSSTNLMTWDNNGNLFISTGDLNLYPLRCPGGQTAPVSVDSTGKLIRGTCI